jgi:hypothetical protein
MTPGHIAALVKDRLDVSRETNYVRDNRVDRIKPFILAGLPGYDPYKGDNQKNEFFHGSVFFKIKKKASIK